jgi:hypothetical protein
MTTKCEEDHSRHQWDRCVKVILLIPFEEDHHGARSPYSIEEDQTSHTDTLAPWSDPLRRVRRLPSAAAERMRRHRQRRREGLTHIGID